MRSPRRRAKYKPMYSQQWEGNNVIEVDLVSARRKKPYDVVRWWSVVPDSAGGFVITGLPKLDYLLSHN